ncbi:MAG TPA: hypothetical protein VFU40_12400, partial [Gemmatimonadales bacterium]|nr:hypothetical protein [Gemmatimonadales bacterium]
GAVNDRNPATNPRPAARRSTLVVIAADSAGDAEGAEGAEGAEKAEEAVGAEGAEKAERAAGAKTVDYTGAQHVSSSRARGDRPT